MKKNSARKMLTGTVLSNKMEKTVVVAVTSATKHSMYNKRMKMTKKYKAHDENNQCGIGDKVSIEECRPLSKDKRWNVVSILEKSPGVNA